MRTILIGIFLLFIDDEVRCQDSARFLSETAISKLLPKKIKGYKISETTASILKNQKASACKRKFERDDASISMWLFDYVDSKKSYERHVAHLDHTNHEFSSDSIVTQKIITPEYQGWVIHAIKEELILISLGVHDRFFFSMSSSHVSMDEFKKILRKIPLKNTRIKLKRNGARKPAEHR